MKSLSRTYVLRPEPNEVWTALVHRFGLPGLPEWAEEIARVLRENARIRSVDSIGCCAAEISVTVEELITWLESGVQDQRLSIPKENGPIRWPEGAPSMALQPGFFSSLRRERSSEAW